MGSCHSKYQSKVKSKIFPGDRVKYVTFKGSLEVLYNYRSFVKTLRQLNLSHIVVHRVVEYSHSKIKIIHNNVFSSITSIHKYKYVEYNRVLVQLCYGVFLLNNSNIIHGNLKPSNVLISDDYHISISDYAINTIRTNCDNNTNILQFYSPEQLSGKEVTSTTDVWGIGLLIFYLLTGHTPAYFNYSEMIELIKTSDIIMNEKLKKKFIELFKKTMKYNPTERITVKEIIDEMDNTNIVEAKYYDTQKYKGFIVFNNLKWLFSYLSVASDNELTMEIVRHFNARPSNRFLFLLINMIWAKRDASFLKTSHHYTEIDKRFFKKNGLIVRCIKTPYCILLNGYDLRELHINKIVDCFKYVSLLQYLDLRQSHLTPNMMKLIVNQIEILRNLKTMRIDNNPNNNQSMRYIRHYFAILIDYNLWGEACVSFYNMSIKDSGLRHLIKHMKHLRNIKILDLASNNLTNDGITELAENMSKLCSLKQLSLQWNDFNDCNCLNKMLETCSQLTISINKDTFDYFSINSLRSKWDKRLDLDNIDVIR